MNEAMTEIDSLIHLYAGDDHLEQFWEAINRYTLSETLSLRAQLEEAQIDAANGSAWFNSFQDLQGCLLEMGLWGEEDIDDSRPEETLKNGIRRALAAKDAELNEVRQSLQAATDFTQRISELLGVLPDYRACTEALQVAIQRAEESESDLLLSRREILRVEGERNDMIHREHEALEQMRMCHDHLDRLGAPRNQDNGLPYSLSGRLSRLIGNAVDRHWGATIRRLEARAEDAESALAAARKELAVKTAEVEGMREALKLGADLSNITRIMVNAFTENGHPGEPAVRSEWVRKASYLGWVKALDCAELKIRAALSSREDKP